MSVTLVHPAKAVGWNEMPFGSDTRVVSGNIVLDKGPLPPPTGREDFGDRIGDLNPSQICIANYVQTVTDSGIVTINSL